MGYGRGQIGVWERRYGGERGEVKEVTDVVRGGDCFGKPIKDTPRSSYMWSLAQSMLQM